MPEKDELTGWVAESGDSHTKVLEPIEIDDIAEADLRPYHPVPPVRGACKFKLIRDPNGGNVAVVDVIPDNWQPKFIKVLENLRFQVAVHPVIGEYLRDPNVSFPDELLMGTQNKWRVLEWQIVRTQIDARTLQVVQLKDVIRWQDQDGRLALSSYTWKPYPPHQAGT